MTQALRALVSFFAGVALAGCSYALVPETKSVSEKLAQAQAMMEVGRYIPAEGLGLQALALARASSNAAEQANAHRYLGNFYKSALYRQNEEWFQAEGRYDSTAALSRSHFAAAQKLWQEAGDFWGVATEHFNLGTTYEIDGDKTSACRSYREALATYDAPTTVFVGRIHPWNPAFETFPDLVQAFAKRAGCALEIAAPQSNSPVQRDAASGRAADR